MAHPDGKKKKKRNKKKKTFQDDEFQMESAGLVKKLAERYGKKASQPEGEVIKEAVVRMGKLLHPTKYEQNIERRRRAQLTRICAPPEAPEALLPTRWVCALCQQYSCYASLGDLFGPYYIELDAATNPPPSTLLTPETVIPTEGTLNLDVYMHGRCALWAKNLFFFGGKFPKLEERLREYWSTKCVHCEEFGASIQCCESPTAGSPFSHYQCLLSLGYQLNADDFSIRPPHLC